MTARYKTIEEWVAAFEAWTGLTVLNQTVHVYGYVVDVYSPNKVLIARLTVMKSEEGVMFGASEPAFHASWDKLCSSDFP